MSKLIQVCLIVKNGSDTIKACLESYVGKVDRFVILDTGSTDNTMRIIKDFKKICPVPVILYQHEFEGFSESRNRCLDLAYDLNYTFIIMIDDSYNLVGDFNELIPYQLDEKAQGFSITVVRENTKYLSRRIFRTACKKFRYKGTIHEVLNCPNNFTLTSVLLDDIPNKNQVKRSQARCFDDLKALKGLKDPRSLYYRANILYQMYNLGYTNFESVTTAFLTRCNCINNDPEETFASWMTLGHLYLSKEMNNDAVMAYFQAVDAWPSRSGEAYLYMYLASTKLWALTKAYANRYYDTLGIVSRLMIDISIYDNFNNYGLISQQMFSYKRELVMDSLLKKYLGSQK